MITYRHISLCPTCKSYHLNDIASHFELWGDYMDPSGIDTEAQFEARGFEQNMNALLNCGMEDNCANA
jgi:hypothetical protein